MIKEFRFVFDELEIIDSDLKELMGFEDETIPEPFPELIENAFKLAPELCDIKGGYKVFEKVEIDLSNETIRIEDKFFNPSKIVVTQMKESSSFAIFLCTAGRGFTDFTKQNGLENDPLLAYVIDILGSVTVEKAIDKIQDLMKLEYQKSGLGITDRFSPGYCEWSVGEQKQLFSLMPDNFCDIQLSDSSLMSPIKSVSGIIGIGKGARQKGYQCNWCSDTNCLYGKIKRNKNVLKK